MIKFGKLVFEDPQNISPILADLIRNLQKYPKDSPFSALPTPIVRKGYLFSHL